MDVDGSVGEASGSQMRNGSALDESEDVFEEATNLESKFFKEGYESGFAHGRLHGLFEGRALGQEQGFEVWEELGFYEGFAMVCLDILRPGEPSEGRAKSKDARALAHADALIDLIKGFPTSNPTPAASQATQGAPSPPTGGADVDLAGLMSSIRAKYRLLCTSVSARPRLQTAPPASTSTNGQAETEGVEGPIKGVDYSALRY